MRKLCIFMFMVLCSLQFEIMALIGIISARCNLYISHLCYDVSVCLSVCDRSALWSRCMPERGGASYASHC